MTTFTLIDVSHSIEDGMITYKGLPPPIISDHLSRENSRALYETATEFQIGKIEMVANTGTYLDSPFHRYADGEDLAELDLRSLANLEGIVIRNSATSDLAENSGPIAITPTALKNVDAAGKAVLFDTGWDKHWRTEEYSSGNHPFLTPAAAEYLANAGAALVAIDSYNIDATLDNSRPVHSILLAHGIPIVEHLCGLRELPESGFRFFAVPVKVRRFGSFPVRAFAVVADD